MEGFLQFYFTAGAILGVVAWGIDNAQNKEDGEPLELILKLPVWVMICGFAWPFVVIHFIKTGRISD